LPSLLAEETILSSFNWLEIPRTGQDLHENPWDPVNDKVIRILPKKIDWYYLRLTNILGMDFFL
jgi:hypothetical protein